MLKKNCHLVFESQKSKLTLLEFVLQTACAIPPPPITNRVKTHQGSNQNRPFSSVHPLYYEIKYTDFKVKEIGEE